jgi:hypothetical protein
MISGPFERVISPLRKHTNGDNNKWQTQPSRFCLITLRQQQSKTIKTHIAAWDRHEKLGRVKSKETFFFIIYIK